MIHETLGLRFNTPVGEGGGVKNSGKKTKQFCSAN